LVAKKWVKRSTSTIDKRETVINLTQTGIEILDTSTDKVEQLFGRILTLNNTEALQLNELLEKLREKE
jgi:DNA-binding MarR family transcriptional regulator